MKKQFFLASFVLVFSSVAAMEVAVENSGLTQKVHVQDVILRSCDGKTLLFPASHVQYSEWVINSIESDKNYSVDSDQSLVLKVPFKFDALENVTKLLGYLVSKKTRELKDAVWWRNSLEKLADVLKISSFLKLDELKDYVANVFIKKVTNHLEDFTEQDRWIDTFGFDEDVSLYLGQLALKWSKRSILKIVSTELECEFIPEHIRFNAYNDLVALFGTRKDGKSVCFLWDLDLKKDVRTIVMDDRILDVAFLGRCVLVRTNKEVLKYSMSRRFQNGQPLISVDDPDLLKKAGEETLWGMTLSPSLSYLVVGIGDILVVREMIGRKRTTILEAAHSDVELAKGDELLVSPDCQTIIEKRSNGQVRFWDKDSGECVSDCKEHEAPINIFFCAKGNELVTVSPDSVCWWSLLGSNKGSLVRKFSGEVIGLQNKKVLDRTPSGSHIAFALPSNGAMIFDVAKSSVCDFLKCSEKIVKGRYHPDAIRLATLSDQNDVSVWDTQTGDLLVSFPCQGQAPIFTFSPGARSFVLSTQKGDVRFLHYFNDKFIRCLERLKLKEALLVKLVAQSKEKDSRKDLIKYLTTLLQKKHLGAAWEQLDQDFAEVLCGQRRDLRARDRCECTLLHRAAARGNVEVVEHLLEHRVIVDDQDKWNRTALHLAAQAGHVEICKMLVDAGSSLESKSISNEWTPLHVASWFGQVDVVEFLLECGADSSTKDRYGASLLYSAAYGGHVEICRVLLARERTLLNQISGTNKWTPLHTAAFRGRKVVVEFLIECGADVAVLDKKGNTAFGLAGQKGHVEICVLLERKTEGENQTGETGTDCGATEIDD